MYSIGLEHCGERSVGNIIYVDILYFKEPSVQIYSDVAKWVMVTIMYPAIVNSRINHGCIFCSILYYYIIFKDYSSLGVRYRDLQDKKFELDLTLI